VIGLGFFVGGYFEGKPLGLQVLGGRMAPFSSKDGLDDGLDDVGSK
jgi:hypothetical protein